MPLYQFSEKQHQVGDIVGDLVVMEIDYRVLPSVLAGNHTCRERGWSQWLQPEIPVQRLRLGGRQGELFRGMGY